jgi:hypothetical protein
MRDPHDREIELSFWESVRASDNPALIQAYLEKYSNGEFTALARIRVDELTDDKHTALGTAVGPIAGEHYVIPAEAGI